MNGNQATCHATCQLVSVAQDLIKCCSVTFEREPLCRRQDEQCDIQLEAGEMDGSWGKVPTPVFELTKRCMSLLNESRPPFGGDGSVVDALQEALQELRS